MNVNFEIAALVPSPYSRVKKSGNFKTNIHLVSVESFLYYLSSNTNKPESEFSHRPRAKSKFIVSKANFKYILHIRYIFVNKVSKNLENIFTIQSIY